MVHAKPLEEKLMAEGQGVQRYVAMYDDFVLIGPKFATATVHGTKDLAVPSLRSSVAQGTSTRSQAIASTPSSSSARTRTSERPRHRAPRGGHARRGVRLRHGGPWRRLGLSRGARARRRGPAPDATDRARAQHPRVRDRHLQVLARGLL